MRQVDNIQVLRECLTPVRKRDGYIAFVPTMGNLHAGHLSLVQLAKQQADYIVVSIFVNPAQFVAEEDFDHYPRTMEADLAMLEALDVNLVFLPSIEEVYPERGTTQTEVTVHGLDSIYCGAYRPGHFKGVATIVTKLFNMVQPHIAIFGKKDFQQLLVIHRLVKDLNIPVDIISAPIIREKDGLAMSSRNRYLTESERRVAPKLFQYLTDMALSIKNGNNKYQEIEEKTVSDLKNYGFRPEYVKICDATDLKSPKDRDLVIIAAAWLGKARLIDNIAVQIYD